MKIKILKNFVYIGEERRIQNQVVDNVPDEIGKALIADGAAEDLTPAPTVIPSEAAEPPKGKDKAHGTR